MEYNRPHATATWGTMGTDWEAGVDFRKLNLNRAERAKAAVKEAGLGAVLCFTYDNIRYVTGTHIGEWGRDKFDRYALCPAEGDAYLWDPAPPAKRKSSPWLGDRIAAPISTLQGALPPMHGIQDDFAKQIKSMLIEMGLDKEPLGIDLMELPMLRALEAQGIVVVDGQQAMLNAREVKTPEEIELLKQASAMVDATYVDISRAIRPGARESDLVAIAHDRLFKLGSERVECVNSVAGPRGAPHSHTFSDRIIQPGDMIFLDVMHSFNGYRTCYYRTFNVGKATVAQRDAYKKAREWIDASISLVKPGMTTDRIAKVWPKAEAFGFDSEMEAFALQFGHGIGVALHERPIISRLCSFDHPSEIKEGMVFALETYCPAKDGYSAARIEEEVVVTADGCRIITLFPADELPISNPY